MAPTADQIEQLRRMVAEPTETTYSDETLSAYIASYPRIDYVGRSPFRITTSVPGIPEVNPFWQEGYDLNAAAAAVWSEKASALVGKFDFSTDGQSFSRSQMYEHANKEARKYAARRNPSTITLTPAPLLESVTDTTEFIET